MLTVQRETRDAILYAAPFVAWIALQMALPATAVGYAVRTGVTAAVSLACLKVLKVFKVSNALNDPNPLNNPNAPNHLNLPNAPNHLNDLNHPNHPNDLNHPNHPNDLNHLNNLKSFHHLNALKCLCIGLFGGLVVNVLWIAPEYSTWYRTWLELPIGELPPASGPSPYEPSVCGWPLTIVKLIGSAFVIAPVEEVFFRSFLYRRLQARDFRAMPLSRFDLSSFLWMVFLFTLEHDRPVVAALAGAAYGLLAIRFGLGSAIVAHVVTNLALGLHVICRGEWWFW